MKKKNSLRDLGEKEVVRLPLKIIIFSECEFMETNGKQRYHLKNMYIILINILLRYHAESMKTNAEKLEVQRD